MVVTGWSLNRCESSTSEPSSNVFPRSRCKHAACLRAGIVYVIGGKDANIPLNDVWSYDIGMLMIRDQPNSWGKMRDFTVEFLKCVTFHGQFTEEVSVNCNTIIFI